MKKRFTLPLWLLVLLAIPSPAQKVRTHDLNGEWSFRRANTGQWLPAKVPGVVHLDLLYNGLIPDPFFGENEKQLQWIGDETWEYQNAFFLNDTLADKQNIELVFDGLDTYASVYLNDNLLFESDNMFRTWSAAINKKCHPGINTIRVLFHPAAAKNSERYSRLPLKLPGDERVVGRKAGYQYGWDWGPVFITCGIWQRVFLRFWEETRIASVNLVQEEITNQKATIKSEFTIQAEKEDSMRLVIRADSGEVFSHAFRVVRGNNMITCKLNILDPIRWWPNGMGEPHLYMITWELIRGNQIIEKGQRRIGLRTIELVQDRDSIGQSFYFKVNGLPVFIKGANYIPQESFLPRVTDSDYETLVEAVRTAHMNMLRIWGGGIYEKEQFYDLCDEKGILVWQDFMFACALFPGDSAFFNNVAAEVRDQLIRLRNHPCLALWCGNNEVDEGWKNWGWQQQYKYSPADSTAVYHDYLALFDSLIPAVLDRYDPWHPYIESSPLHGWGRSLSMREGDSHYWGVWWGKEPFEVYEKKTGRFMSEYGFQGFPDYTTLEKVTLPEDRRLGSDVLKNHQKHPTGFETIDEYLMRDYQKPTTLRSYTLVSQLLQADGMRIAIRAHRKRKPDCMGTLYWQLNDCWPVVSWSSIDYYGNKKALYYEAKRLFEPILIIPAEETGVVRLYLTSDLAQPITKDMIVRLIAFDGRLLREVRFQATAGPEKTALVYQSLKDEFLAGADTTRIVLSAQFADDTLTNPSLLFFSAPKNLRLERPEITIHCSKTTKGAELILTSRKLVKGLHISTTLAGEFSDNYLDLLPDRVYRINFSSPLEIVDPERLFTFESLNDSYPLP